MSQVQILLDQPSTQWRRKHWQYIVLTLFTSIGIVSEAQDLCVRLNVGDLDFTNKITGRILRWEWHSAAHDSWSEAATSEPRARPDVIRRTERAKMHGAVLIWKAVLGSKRETICLLWVLRKAGIIARKYDLELRLESFGRTESVESRADNVCDLVREAEGLDDDRDKWLVLEGRKACGKVDRFQ